MKKGKKRVPTEGQAKASVRKRANKKVNIASLKAKATQQGTTAFTVGNAQFREIEHFKEQKPLVSGRGRLAPPKTPTEEKRTAYTPRADALAKL